MKRLRKIQWFSLQYMDENNIFTASAIDGGYSYTITNIWPEILSFAESMYGPRDCSFTIIGVELYDGSQPQTWYPRYDSQKYVAIQLTKECNTDMKRAIFQAAHELIHCLCPKPGRHANVLEEGLASLFSEIASMKYDSSYRVSSKKYQYAMAKVSELLRHDQDIIKKIRVETLDISSITSKQLKNVCPDLEDELIDILLMPFSQLNA